MSRVALWFVALAPLVTLVAASAGCTLLLGYPGPVGEHGASACTNGIDDDLDGAADCGDSECAAFCIEAPALPAAPAIVCGDGWSARALEPRPTGVDALATCDPPADAMLLTGGPCGPMPPGVVHVLAGALAGGDGSVAHPFRHVADGIAAANENGTVLIAGDLDESVVVDRPVTLMSDCIAGSLSATTGPVLEIAASPVSVMGLVLHGRVVVDAGARLELSGSILEEADGSGAALSLAPTARVVIAYTLIRTDDAALDVNGARATLTNAAIRGRIGRVAGAVARLDADRLFVARTESTEAAGPMLDFAGEATGALEHVVIEAALADGIAMDGAGATLTLADVIVARSGEASTLPRTLLGVAGGAVATGDRVALLGASSVALEVNTGSSAELGDLIVAFMATPTSGATVAGARVHGGASLTASGVLVDRADVGIDIGPDETLASATLDRLVVRATRAGDAIQVGTEASITLRDFYVMGSTGCGLDILSPDVPSAAMIVRFVHGTGAFVSNTTGVCFSQSELRASDFGGILFRDNGADARVDGTSRCFTDLSVNCGR